MLDHRIDTFLTVCQVMNYREAAQLLHITQPAVTQHIQFLEKEYGCRLFLYENRRLEKTREAVLLEEHIRSVRQREQFLRQNLSGSGLRELKIGATKTIGDYVINEQVRRCLMQDETALTLIVDNTEHLLKLLEQNQQNDQNQQTQDNQNNQNNQDNQNQNQPQNQPQGGDDNQDKNDQNNDNQNQNQDQNKDNQQGGGDQNEDKKEQPQQPKQQPKSGMSEEQQQQLLDAIQAQEDKTQDKLDKKAKGGIVKGIDIHLAHVIGLAHIMKFNKCHCLHSKIILSVIVT